MTLNLRSLAIALACCALWCALPARTGADIARPENPDGKNSVPRPSRNDQLVTVQIEGTDGWQAMMYVPESLIAAETAPQASGMSAAGTAVSGVALSLSLVFGGLWLAKSRRRIGTQATMAAAAILAVLAGTATYALANASPYPLANPGTLRQAAPNGDPLKGQVRLIRVPDDGSKTIRLVLPRDQE